MAEESLTDEEDEGDTNRFATVPKFRNYSKEDLERLAGAMWHKLQQNDDELNEAGKTQLELVEMLKNAKACCETYEARASAAEARARAAEARERAAEARSSALPLSESPPPPPEGVVTETNAIADWDGEAQCYGVAIQLFRSAQNNSATADVAASPEALQDVDNLELEEVASMIEVGSFSAGLSLPRHMRAL